MARSTSLANSSRQGGSGSYGFGHQGPRAGFDADVPAGVDPEGQWRMANSSKFRRTGTTAAERQGRVAGYTPGYGRSAPNNSTGANSLTPKSEWDANFVPRLGAQMGQQPPAPPEPSPTPTLPTTPAPAAPLPPAASPGTVLPLTPPPTPPPSPTASPGDISSTTGPGGTFKRVEGLPSGQRATSTIIPGQNNPQNLAKRPRSNPFAT